MKPILITLSLALAPLAYAHEGHNEIPGNVQAPHGGTLKSAGDYYFELVTDTNGVKVYVMDHDLKAVDLSKLKLEATAQPPKKKKAPVKLSLQGDHFAGKPDAQGAYRYTLELSVAAGKKKYKATFQVEPQS